MTPLRVAKRPVDDDGLSLIEIIIYVVLLGVLMAGVSIMFVNTWRAQASIDAQTQATTHGQLVTSEIEKAMRNATGFEITDGGNTLKVQTSFGGDRECQAFHFDPVGGPNNQGTLQMVRDAHPAAAPAAGYVWQQGIRLYTDTTFNQFFTYVDSSGAPTLAAPAGIHYSFRATAPASTTKSGAVTFSGTANARNSSLGGTSTCWP